MSFCIRPTHANGARNAKQRGGRKAVGAHRLALLCACGTLFTGTAAWADPVGAPSFSGPLAPNAKPLTVDAGPFGEVTVTGQVSGIAMAQSHVTNAAGTVTSDTMADLSNAQIEIQTTSGPLQLYVQAGTYALPSLGTPYLRSGKALDQLYGPVPVAYAKAVISPDLSISAGLLPTMVGAESTFTFQNMNIERGLLWNQEPAISRGAQINYTHGKLSAAVSLNDGYYSGKFNWVSGMLSYAIDSSNSITLIGAGSLSRSRHASFATPVAQNNGSIFNIIYTYNSGPLTLTPYLQYNRVDRDDALGISRSAETYGGALLAKYTISNSFSLAARGEYLKSSGQGCGIDPDCTQTNLLYGPHSDAWSLTFTPTYQKGIFFARAEASYTRIGNLAPGSGFGQDFNERDQARVLLETGFLF
jgi:hypothetical protein